MNGIVFRPCPDCLNLGRLTGCGPDHGYEGPCHDGPSIADWERFVRAQSEEAAEAGDSRRLAAIEVAAVDGGVSALVDKADGCIIGRPGAAIEHTGGKNPRIIYFIG